VSYSHKDNGFLDEFEVVLKLLARMRYVH